MKNKNVKIGLDLDGVIIDHTQNKIKTATELGFSVTAKETTSSKFLKAKMPDEAYMELQSRTYDEMSPTAPPIPGAIKSIKELHNRGFELFIISRRKIPGPAVDWLQRYGILDIIPKEKIFFVKKDDQKEKIAQKLKLDIILDDQCKVLKELKSVKHTIFFNVHEVDNEGFCEVNSWKEFLKLVNEITGTNV